MSNPSAPARRKSWVNFEEEWQDLSPEDLIKNVQLQVQKLRNAVRAVFENQLVTEYTRFWVYWELLCDRLQLQLSKVKPYQINRIGSKKQFIAQLAAARDHWTSAESPQDLYKNFPESQITQCEHNLYASFCLCLRDAGVKHVYGDGRIVPHQDHSQKGDRSYYDSAIGDRYKFWFRMFGFFNKPQPIDAFSRAMRIYIQLEYADQYLPDILEDCIREVLDQRDADMRDMPLMVNDTMLHRMLLQYGSFKQIYNRVQSVTRIKSPFAKNRGRGRVGQVPWLVPMNRLEAQEDLIRKEKLRKSPSPTQKVSEDILFPFCVRPGAELPPFQAGQARGFTGHVFSFSHKRKERFGHYKITFLNDSYILDQAGNKALKQSNLIDIVSDIVEQTSMGPDVMRAFNRQKQDWLEFDKEHHKTRPRFMNEYHHQIVEELINLLGMARKITLPKPSLDIEQLDRELKGALDTRELFSQYLDKVEGKTPESKEESEPDNLRRKEHIARYVVVKDGNELPLLEHLVLKAMHDAQWLPLFDRMVILEIVSRKDLVEAVIPNVRQACYTYEGGTIRDTTLEQVIGQLMKGAKPDALFRLLKEALIALTVTSNPDIYKEEFESSFVASLARFHDKAKNIVLYLANLKEKRLRQMEAEHTKDKFVKLCREEALQFLASLLPSNESEEQWMSLTEDWKNFIYDLSGPIQTEDTNLIKCLASTFQTFLKFMSKGTASKTRKGTRAEPMNTGFRPISYQQHETRPASSSLSDWLLNPALTKTKIPETDDGERRIILDKSQHVLLEVASSSAKAYDVMLVLWEMGAQFSVTDSEDESILHKICLCHDSFAPDDILKLSKLLQRQPNKNTHLADVINARNKSYETVLSILLKQTKSNTDSRVEMMMLLILYGARIDGMVTSNFTSDQIKDEAEAEKQRPFDSILNSYLEKNDWARWHILRAAVINGDDDLVKKILYPSSRKRVLPYLFRPCRFMEPGEKDTHGNMVPLWVPTNDPPREIKRTMIHERKIEPRQLSVAPNQEPDLKEFKEGDEFDEEVKKISLNTVDPSESVDDITILRIAIQCANRKEEIVEMLIEHAPNEVDLRKTSKAAEESGCQLDEQLLFYCVTGDLDHSDSSGKTILHWACSDPVPSRTNNNIVELLMNRCKQIQKRDAAGYVPLHYAVYAGRLKVVDMFGKVHANMKTTSGSDTGEGNQVALSRQHTAARQEQRRNDNEILERQSELLQDACRDVFVGGDMQSLSKLLHEQALLPVVPAKRTALHIAAFNGEWQACSSIMSGNTSSNIVNELDDHGWTPLALAMYLRKKIKEVKKAREAYEQAALSNLPGDVARAAHALDHIGRKHHLLYYYFCLNRKQIANSPGDSTASQSELPLSSANNLLAVLSEGQATEDAHPAPSLVVNSSSQDLEMSRNDLKEFKRHWVNDFAPSVDKMTALIADFDQTIEIMFNGGADVKVATESCKKQLKELIDIEDEIILIHSKAQEYDQQIQDEQERSEDREEGVTLLKKQKRNIFEDKRNQIVIDEYFKQHVRQRQLWKLITYFFFVVLLTILGIQESTRDEIAAHFLHRSFEERLIRDEFDFSESKLLRTYQDIDNKDEFWQWMRGVFVPSFYPTSFPQYWDGAQLVDMVGAISSSGALLPGGFVNDQNRVIGVPRVRQLRSKVSRCDLENDLFPNDFDNIGVNCFSVVSNRESQEKSTFGPPSLQAKAGTWYSSDQLDGILTVGQVGTYTGGGYIVDFPSNFDSNSSAMATDLINQLEANQWIDARTRAIFVEFTTYNPNHNFFVAGKILLEIPRSGGILPLYEFTIARLKKYITRDDVFVFFLEFFVLGYFLMSSLDGLIYCKIDTRSVYWYISLLMNLLVFMIIIIHVLTILWSRQVDWENRVTFEALTHKIAYFAQMENAFFSLLIFFAWLKLLDYLNVIQIISRLLVMIVMMIRKLFNFLVLFGIILATFASAEYVAFGYSTKTAYTWLFGLVTRISTTFAEQEINAFVGDHRLLGTFYGLAFVLIVSLLLLNLVIAMMTTAYEEARMDSGETYWAEQQFEMIIKFSREAQQGRLQKRFSSRLRAFIFALATTTVKLSRNIFKRLNKMCRNRDSCCFKHCGSRRRVTLIHMQRQDRPNTAEYQKIADPNGYMSPRYHS